MKLAHKLFILALGCGFISSCTDLNTFPEGGNLTSTQITETALALPERVSADVNGMYSVIGNQYCVYGSVSSRDDDAGFPTVCLSQDLNGPDMVSDNSNYNWFSVSSQYTDRADTYANPYMRWAVFYNQMKLANDILATIPADTNDSLLIIYKAQ
ncbi:MAG: RagB/SusD family nutrient uptake outer membrane protein, partial [Paludibacter sp.]